MCYFSSSLSVIQEDPENIGSPYWNLLSVGVSRADGTTSVITGTDNINHLLTFYSGAVL